MSKSYFIATDRLSPSPLPKCCLKPKRVLENPPIRDDIDPKGDIFLILQSTSTPARFRVSSDLLRKTSDVFKRILQADLDSTPIIKTIPKEVVLDLEQDDHNVLALSLALRACHQKEFFCPAKINDLKFLYNLALVSNQFDIAKPLIPWVCKWVVQPHQTVRTAMQWLFIAWTFRLPTEFKRFSKAVICNSEVHVGSGLQLSKIRPDGQRIYSDTLPESMPKALIDAITRQRAERLTSILKFCHELLSKYHSDDVDRCLASKDEQVDCNAYFRSRLASAFMSSHFLSTWPQTMDPTHQTLRDAVSPLRRLSICSDYRSTHTGCDSLPSILSFVYAYDNWDGLSLSVFYPEDRTVITQGCPSAECSETEDAEVL